ncbi:MAG: hypothetical protein KF730_11135 [Sphingomonas sp.]|uniref:hypothetical protein n=1 Tax=Sphingomonas sp. TaxID=28214 RepID=UPI0025E296ED|nr:hypothetical protein [Sphingomonas sp.]MBX3565114.1 hypothetical protein [Sphingomonas sp.]
MAREKQLPLALAQLAERNTWFSGADAMRILDWLEAEKLPLQGFEVARKLSDGNWMLLLDPMIDFPDGTPVPEIIDAGRTFLHEYAATDLMFEPRWAGY